MNANALRTATRVLSPDGVLTIWNSAPAPAFVARMNEHFAEVEITEVFAAQGEPDVMGRGRVPLKSAAACP